MLGPPCRRVMLATDASLTGWGAVMDSHLAHGLWSGRYLTWHINWLEMRVVFQALRHFLPDLRDHHVLVHTNNTAVVSYINRQGGLRSLPLYRLVHQILVWSQSKLLSLRAVYIPGHLIVGADTLSRQGPRPEDLESVWPGSGGPFCNSEDIAMSPLVHSDSYGSPGAGCYGTDLAETSSVCLSPNCSAPRSSGKTALGRGPADASCPVLAGPRRINTGLTHSTLKVYVAVISAYHASFSGQSVRRHDLVTCLLRGALRLRPPVWSRIPPWDLALLLEALCRSPLEPIEESLIAISP